MSLTEHRKAIDQLDAQIVRLLNERTRHVLAIGEIKLRQGEEIYAPHRERAVLQRICKLNGGPITDESLRAIYREVMSSALSLEKSMTIACLGPEAGWTHLAAVGKFGSSLRYAAQQTIADVFNEVSLGRAEYGVAPVEDSVEGTITHTLDMFVDSDLKIVAQIALRVRHSLAGQSGPGEIKTLCAQPQALAQCRRWVERHLPGVKLVETATTLEAVNRARAGRRTAAICNALAARSRGVPLVARDIQDDPNQSSRFIVLGRQCGPPTGADRTSLLLSVENKVGALDQVLALFRRSRVNLLKIESRPNPASPGEHFIYLDCEGHADDPAVRRAMQRLHGNCRLLKVLGTYPNTETEG
jgi:chorismate mutase / prephenate dehydratase